MELCNTDYPVSKPKNKYWVWVEKPNYFYYEVIAESETDAGYLTKKQLGQNTIVHRILDTNPNDHNGEL